MNIYPVKYLQDVDILDPDSKGYVTLSVYKDPKSGGVFAIDSSYLDQVTDIVPLPFTKSMEDIIEWVELPEE